jgi:hypothetical protein
MLFSTIRLPRHRAEFSIEGGTWFGGNKVEVAWVSVSGGEGCVTCTHWLLVSYITYVVPYRSFSSVRISRSLNTPIILHD